jgi:CBS domain-containing protein/mannitol/fructose-specific phosphotransferase system IIA component (Ntr-type)
LTDQDIKLSSLFSPAQILCGLCDTTLDQVVRRLIGLIGASDPSVDIERVFRRVLAREKCGLWLIEPGMAVVHARVEGMRQLRIALATSAEGIACTSDHGDLGCTDNLAERVNVVLLMLAPADDTVSYLRAVAALTSACRKTGLVERLLTSEDPQRAWMVFESTGAYLPAYVRAQDIMCTDFPRLGDTETVSDAIDMFCREGMSELPVVDADGDLIGLVTEAELIRVCLPEYITWMDDLSTILNFEPFAEILRREPRMPVREIMVFAERYATVDEATPAIQVAKVMVRRDVRQVLVVREKNLVGVIAIQDFIHKILRA